MFLSVGTDFIYPDFFTDIKNTCIKKPVGGLWATKQGEVMQYNPWIDFILSNPNVFFYKSGSNPFNQPAVLIKLKEQANICTIDSKEKLDFILKNYPDGKGWIDFEKLAEHYDGVFISVLNISIYTDPDMEIQRKYSVDSLIIFNLACIEFFQKARVEIEPFDYEMPGIETRYQIVVDEEKHYLSSANAKIQMAIEKIAEFIYEFDIPMNNDYYEVIKRVFADLIAQTKDALNSEQHETNNDFETLLIRKAFSQS